MKTTALIAEYNPFHNGHSWQLDWIRKNLDTEAIVVLMSGNFTQRGGLAVHDKYLRAEAALKNGADLVLELPSVYSCANAETYASSAVRIIDSLKTCSSLCFGMENPEKLEVLEEITDILLNESVKFRKLLRKGLDEGKSFIVSRSDALEQITGKDLSFMKKANNILACEYLKELKRIESGITPVGVKRTEGKGIKSASFIRDELLNGRDVSDFVPKASLSPERARSLDEFSDTIRHRIVTMTDEELRSLPDMENGLENRIRKAAFSCRTAEEICSEVSTARYTRNRIRRILLYILLGYTKADMEKIKNHTPSFVKILGFTSRGRKVLRKISEKSETDMITRYGKDMKKKDDTDRLIFERNVSWDNLYGLDQKKENQDFTRNPIFSDDN